MPTKFAFIVQVKKKKLNTCWLPADLYCILYLPVDKGEYCRLSISPHATENKGEIINALTG